MIPGMASDQKQQKTAHHITFGDRPGRARVVFGGETIAETTNAVVLKEGPIPPVFYVPRADVRQDVLIRTEHTTYCPFKGDASYWTIRVGDHEADNAVWSYEAPYDQVAVIKDHMAFYTDRMDAFDAEE